MTIPLFTADVVDLGAEPDRDTWTSPPEVVGALMRFTNGEPVDLDPCSNDRSIVPAKTRWTRDDAPTADPIRPWLGTVYCNWPFSTPEPWSRACEEEATHGGALWVIGCGICDTSTKWFQHCWRAVAICFPDHRIQYGRPPGADESSNDKPSMLPLWCSRSHPLRAEWLLKFQDAFSSLGKVVLL